MKEGDNQRDQVQVWASLTQGSCTPLKLRWTAAVKQSETIEHLPKVSAQPYTLSLRFSPSWLPLSLPIPTPRRGVGGTHKTTWTLYILSMQGRLTLHVRILVHISKVSGVFFEGSMSVQLYRCTHEIINTLSVLKLFSAVFVIYFNVQL